MRNAIFFFILILPMMASGQEFGRYFSKKEYTPNPIPTFESSRRLLPRPVLGDDSRFMGMYWKTWELAFEHFKQPEPGSPFVSNILDEAFAPNIFQWDMIFMVMFARYADHVFPAVESLDNFYCRQHPGGYICREIAEATGEDFVYEGRVHTVNPPLFSWAEVESFKNTGDTSRFRMVLPVLEKYVEWLNRNGDPETANGADWDQYGRRAAGSKHKLYWNTGLGSGMDNTPRGGNGWVDMSCQMVIQYNNLAEMAGELGMSAKARDFRKEAKRIGNRINRWCWNEEDGLYYDVDNEGRQVQWKTAGCFWPLLAGVASKKQAERLVAHIQDTSEFWRPFVFPTLAADQKSYDPKGGYWLGGVWAPTNYMIIKGLERYGYEDLARKATEKYLDAMNRVFLKTGTVWENYAPEAFAPGDPAKPDFVGWTGIGPIALLIENLLGFRVDGAGQRLTWKISGTDAHGIEDLRVGETVVSAFCRERKSLVELPVVEVVTSGPLELTVEWEGGKVVFPMTTGKHVLKTAIFRPQ